MRKKDIVFFVIPILIIVSIMWFLHQMSKETFMHSNETKIKIEFTKINKSVFLKARAWGLNGDHQEIVLSEYKNAITDKAKDYIFYTSAIYYKTDDSGLITVFAPEVQSVNLQ